MGKGKTRAVEKGVLGQNVGVSSSSSSSGSSLHVPPAPVYYPTEDEFKDPLEYISKIRAEAEKYGICRIVPPKSWSPPFALNLDGFSFPTKTQAIHQLQARPASCDSKTFELEYGRFLEDHCGKKLKKRVVFEGEELDFCKLFNAVKRFGGYDKVSKEKKWGEVSKFVRSGRKVSECAKHVLCQLYREHLYDYEEYYNKLNKEVTKGCKRGVREYKKSEYDAEVPCAKRRRKKSDGEKVKVFRKSEKKKEEFDQICEQCRSGLHGEVMLLCDRCNKGWHIYCLSPPLKQIPPGNWYCFQCLNSDKDSFGFVPGKCLTLEAFRRVADRARRKWFGSALPARVQMEKKFWEIVEGSAGEVEVIYGSDLDTSIYGSGFPRANDQRPDSVEAKIWDECRDNPWNLNNLPKLKGSMLRVVHNNITGVMVPWLYVGMLFSSFCWHFEDHCFYSMNYLHWGEPKCWYSVPGAEARAFEKVMRSCLPDLFDAQPDLLFQLVTMLNPSVLQENGVPVYSVLQEPGNFVITFPRSYHGGFNFGLNCAEAVNFAPADWLPHGGFGAELYQAYHKTAVICHEELLCVVAKGYCGSEVSPHLKKELLRMYTKEKMCREKIWRSGIVRSSPLPPRKSPEFVGTEEDPICIICKQYLYLSAVVCHCRPSAFACLEHWERICECKSSKLRLLYRYTLAELYELVHTMDKHGSEESLQHKNFQRKISISHELRAVSRKVNGGNIRLAQLAEQWLLRSPEVFHSPYSGDAYATLLKEAEQFLWAGSEVDPVRNVVKNLIVAQKWAEGIRDCLSRIQNWSSCHKVEKVHMDYINELLNVEPLPCNEPGHIKLKEYAEEAKLLIQAIDSALASSSKMFELESIYSRASDFPIYVEQIEKLSHKVSSAKVWLESARKCIPDKCSAAIDVGVLYKLKLEISDLQVELPETKLLLDLLRQAESCQAQCSETLKTPCTRKTVEMILQEWDEFPLKIPELSLLRQHHIAADSWIARCNEILLNIHDRVDQDAVVDELSCLMEEGASLRIQVDELPLIEIGLKKARCRVKALKAHDNKMPIDFIQKLMMEAAVLQIDREELFVDLSGVLASATCWQERATRVLLHRGQMSEFEDLMRTAAEISVILPSLADVEDAVLMAKSWLKSSEPFLVSCSLMAPASCAPLKLEALKGLVLQSKSLKISLEEQIMVETVLKNCEEWEQVAASALQDVQFVCNASSSLGDGKSNGLITRIQLLIARMSSISKSGLSLGFDFAQIPKLQNACSMLQWCTRVLSICSIAPSFEDVESLMKTPEDFSGSCVVGSLWGSLIDGVKWVRKAFGIIPVASNFERCKLSDAEEFLAESKARDISFPVVADQLVNAIQKHKSWQEQVHQFFSLKSQERSWSVILELKELGMAVAFGCPELDMVLSEVKRVERWKQQCLEIVGRFVGDGSSLLDALKQILQAIEKALCYIASKSQRFGARNLCMCCAGYIEDQEFTACSTCHDHYHLQCVESALGDLKNAGLYICPYCHSLDNGSVYQKGGGPLRFGRRRPELKMLVELLSNAENLSVRVEEGGTLQQVVKKALEYKICLREILNSVLSFMGGDLNAISDRLIAALKAVDLAGVYDDQDNHDLGMVWGRNFWRNKVNRLFVVLEKPTMQQIYDHIEEGVAMSIPLEDYFWRKLTDVKHIGSQWADQARKVATDSGALDLEKVFKLITEGENLPVSLENELKLLRARGMLYCICRKPYDDRPKAVCNQCDEWYHLECIKLFSRPEIYVCAACSPEAEGLSILPSTDHERSSGAKLLEPKTPPPRHFKLRMKHSDTKFSLTQKILATTSHTSSFSRYDRILRLRWQTRKPFRRAARKRLEFETLSQFVHIQQ